MTKEEKEKAVFLAISAKILSAVDTGADLEAAFDATLGSGAYKKLSDAVWSALQTKKA